MSVFSPWPYFVLVLVVLGAMALPVFRSADEPHDARDRRTATLDGLRGFLALSVFVHHLMVTHGHIERGEWTFRPRASTPCWGRQAWASSS